MLHVWQVLVAPYVNTDSHEDINTQSLFSNKNICRSHAVSVHRDLISTMDQTWRPLYTLSCVLNRENYLNSKKVVLDNFSSPLPLRPEKLSIIFSHTLQAYLSWRPFCGLFVPLIVNSRMKASCLVHRRLYHCVVTLTLSLLCMWLLYLPLTVNFKCLFRV